MAFEYATVKVIGANLNNSLMSTTCTSTNDILSKVDLRNLHFHEKLF